MILHEVGVRNWRGYRERHTFRFEHGINLVIGRNEAGKSTLFEALTRALFDRHNSKTEDIKAIQPLGSTLAPEVTIQFAAGGKRYKVVKRFLQDPKSELYSERQGKWDLDHEGDHADARLRDILRGEATTRTAARSEHRGLAQALWYLQSDGAIPEKSWNDGVKQGLQGLVQLAARSPREGVILKRLEAAYAESWTPTGRISSTSELGRLQQEMPSLEETLSTLWEKAMKVESYRTDLEEFQSSEAQKRIELQEAERELSGLAERVQAADLLEREKDAKERAATAAAENAQRLKQELLQIDDKHRKIAEWRKEVEEHEESLADTTTEAKQESATGERHASRWKEELEPVLKALEAELRTLHASGNLRKLKKDRERLEKHLEKVSRVLTQLKDRRKERADLIAPDAKERKGLAKAAEELSVLDAKIEASAVRVAFEWDAKAKKVTTQPAMDKTQAGEFIVTEPTEFEIQGVGKVRVRSGAQALKDLVAEREKLHQKVSKALRHFGVKDAEGLAGLYEKRLELDQQIGKFEEAVEEAEISEPDAEAELTRIKRGIEEEARIAGEHVKGTSEGGGQAIRARIAEKEKEKERLITEIDKEQALEKKSRQKHLDLVKARETTSTKLAERKGQIKTQEESIAGALEAYGTLDHLKKLSSKAEEESATARSSLEKFLENYEERVETPKKLYAQANERVKELGKQTQDLRRKVAETLARIEESAAQGNYSQLADLEIAVERKKRRLEVLQRRADGAKLLHDLVGAYEKERSAALSGPVQDLANRWLQLLTEGNYDALRVDDALRPAGVHVKRYGADLPWTSLSHGAQEQVVVLLRLAIGVLASRDGRNLVVIDDRLVNADPVRMKRLCLILQEAAKTCQLVVATCNDTPYAGLGARLVRVPADGIAKEVPA